MKTKREYNQAYYQAHKEQISQKKREYARSAEGREIQHKWQHSEAGKRTDAKYRSSFKGIETKRKYAENLKVAVLAHYGNGECACVMCGESRLACLSLDHINGAGAKQRRTVGAGHSIYRWIIRSNFPEGYQTLCMNCQWVKRKENSEYGYGNKNYTAQ